MDIATVKDWKSLTAALAEVKKAGKFDRGLLKAGLEVRLMHNLFCHCWTTAYVVRSSYYRSATEDLLRED